MRLPVNDWHRVAVYLILLLGIPRCVFGQFVDDFSDGDFSNNPQWLHSDTLWTVVPFESDNALRTNGRSASDTLHIATTSDVVYGTWAFTFRFEDGQLTNFNQVRISVSSDLADLTQPHSGYHVQIGTNNRNVRLYRDDPSVSGGRVLLASSANDIIEASEDTVDVKVTRSPEDEWTVSIDDVPVLSHSESSNAITTSSYFGIWVKHSATRARSYYFDNFDVSDSLPPDTTPPSMLAATYVASANAISVRFSESLDIQTVASSDFNVDGGVGVPSAATVRDPSGGPAASLVRLDFSTRLETGTYYVSASGVADVAGNVLVPASIPVDVQSDTTPPAIIEVVVEDPSTVVVRFSEAVDPSGGCGDTANYVVAPGNRSPNAVTCPSGNTTEASLTFDPALAPGAYSLTASGISDTSGNILDSGVANFAIDFSGDRPVARDLVINEFSYAPVDTDLEFVEVFNRSNKTFDLADFTLADDRLAPVAITTDPYVIGPGEYGVIVRDEGAFSAVYGGLSLASTSSWPALNNTGDAIVLYYGSLAIDSLVFEPSWGGSGVSLERLDPAGPSSNRDNWGSTTAPEGATPGRENSLFGPDTAPPILRFAEQTDDRRATFHFNEPLNPSTVDPAAFDIDGVRPVGVQLHATGTSVLAEFSATIAGRVVTVENVGDLTGNVLSLTSMSLARLPAGREVVINEIMFDPRADSNDGLPDQPEYIEFVNTGSELLTLNGMYWTDRANEQGEADTVRFPQTFVGLEPGGYAVAFSQPESLSDIEVYTSSSIVLAFPRDYDATGTALIHIQSSSLGLLNDGDVLHLRSDRDETLDSLMYDPGWHNPNVVNANGVALERLDPTGQSTLRRNWSSSVVAGGGTPGEANSVFLSPEHEAGASGIRVVPSPFSPDSDGFEDATAIAYSLSATPALIRVRIFDSRGRHVRTLEESALSASTGSVLWDGRDDAGNDLRIGIYIVLLEAIDTAGGRTEVYKAPVVVARTIG